MRRGGTIFSVTGRKQISGQARIVVGLHLRPDSTPATLGRNVLHNLSPPSLVTCDQSQRIVRMAYYSGSKSAG